MAILLSILFGFVPMFLFAYLVYWLDRYEKEPKNLLGGVFIWGAFFASGGAFLINTILGLGIYMFTESKAAANLTTGVFIAPIVEESLKGLAVLIIFLIFRREFDSLLDGVVYAAVTALGFAATENAYYIYTYGYQTGGLTGLYWLAFIRVILVGWQHPFYTSFIGIGLATARLNRNATVKVLAPFLGWFMAVFVHALHNTLGSLLPGGQGLMLGTIFDWSGWLFMFLFVMWSISRERQLMVQYLHEEVSLGTITAAQFHTAISIGLQNQARFKALFSNRYQITHRFYRLCGELAHKKHQLARFGEESGNSTIVERLRTEMARLSPSALPA